LSSSSSPASPIRLSERRAKKNFENLGAKSQAAVLKGLLTAIEKAVSLEKTKDSQLKDIQLGNIPASIGLNHFTLISDSSSVNESEVLFLFLTFTFSLSLIAKH